MAKFNYQVTLPNGETYLTTTLAEAKALQARGGRMVQNPRSPMSRKERMKPLEDYSNYLEAFFREVIQNSFDAEATRLDFEIDDKQFVITCLDNGKGMTPDVLLNKFLVQGMSDKPSWAVGGFGEAKKLLTWPWDNYALITQHKGQPMLVAIGKGDVWDYYENGVCKEVEYDEGDKPVATIGKKAKPEVKGLTLADLAPMIKQIEKQGHGTILFIRGVDAIKQHSLEYSKTVRGNCGLPTEASAVAYITKCNLPARTIAVNGKKIPCNLTHGPKARKFPRPVDGTEMWLEAAKSPEDVGAMLIRANGVLMWSEPCPTDGTVFVDIVADTKKLLTSNRDSFKYYPQQQWDMFKQKFAKDVGSTFRAETKFDMEFSGTGPSRADRDEVREAKYRAASLLRSAARKEEKPADVKKELNEVIEQLQQEVEQRKKEEQEFGGIERKESTPWEQISAPPKEVQDAIVDQVVNNTEDAHGAANLLLWQPSLRVKNELEDWEVTPDYLPSTMGERQIRILRAWTEAIRRTLSILSEYYHEFNVGFIFSESVLAETDDSKENWQVKSYTLNPFVSASELRGEQLQIPREQVSLIPTGEGIIPINPLDEQHLAIITARALHELVHGVYRIGGHDEHFSSALTMMMAKVGGKEYVTILQAARAGARAAVPKLKGRKSGGATAAPTASGRRTPQRVERVAGADPRLPPVGTVLEKSGLRVLIGQGLIYVLKSAHDKGYGTAKSISQAVEQHLSAVSGKPRSASGFVYFDLTPDKRSKYIKGTLTNSDIADIVLDMREGHSPYEDLNRYDGWRDAR
jgi:hypothetical protein